MKENVNAPLVRLIDQTLLESKDRFPTLDNFKEIVLANYERYLKGNSVSISSIDRDTKEELLLAIEEITKKKMYGFYDINEYRDFLVKNNA